MSHTVLIKLVFCHEWSEVFLFDGFLDGCPWQIDSEVQVAKVNSHVMVLDLIALILCSSVASIALRMQMIDLLVSIFDILGQSACRQMAVQKDEGRVFEAKTHHYCAFVAGFISHWSLDRWHGNVKDPGLDFWLGDKHYVETMLVRLSHQGVRGWASLSIETAHYVILHELQPLFVDFFVEHTTALILDDVLEADDKNVWQICRVSNSWQEPIT